jgi:uncharacterized protein (TIGR03083 family)
MTITQTAVETLTELPYDEVMDLAEIECHHVVALAESLTDDEWQRPTDCALWSVRDILGHLLGMWQLDADPDVRAEQLAIASERSAASGRVRIDELTGLQVEQNAALGTASLVEALREAAPRALAARRFLPEELRQHAYDSELPGEPMWTMGYLFGVIHTRDPWLHRVDICRATGRELTLTPEHDGRIVADVVRDWCARHQTPVTLHLTGAAGGDYVYAGGGEELTLDAVEFCRVLSGRAPGDGLLAVRVIF